MLSMSSMNLVVRREGFQNINVLVIDTTFMVHIYDSDNKYQGVIADQPRQAVDA